MFDHLKQNFSRNMQAFAKGVASDVLQGVGKSYPCTVTKVVKPGIVTVNFEVNSSPFTIPQATVPVGYPEYIRYPIQVGDKGFCVSADVRLGGITGLGSGVPDLTRPGNLSALVFFWLGNTNWFATDPQALTQYTSQDCLNVISPIGVSVTGVNGNHSVEGNQSVGNAASYTSTSPTGQITTVRQGITTIVGDATLDIAWFESLASQFSAATSPEQLQALVTSSFNSIAANATSMNGQLQLLFPILALLISPTDLPSVITFLGNFITGFLTPYVVPYTNLITQYGSMLAQVTALTTAVNSAATRLNTTITIPSIPPLVIP